jgi:hypothetical protein
MEYVQNKRYKKGLGDPVGVEPADESPPLGEFERPQEIDVKDRGQRAKDHDTDEIDDYPAPFFRPFLLAQKPDEDVDAGMRVLPRREGYREKGRKNENIQSQIRDPYDLQVEPVTIYDLKHGKKRSEHQPEDGHDVFKNRE